MPNKGQRTEVIAQLTGGPLGGDYSYYRIELHSAHYFRGLLPGHVLELGARTGVMQSFGDTSDVPFFERYYLGGLSTLRGFKFRYISPRQVPNIPDNEPIGGDTYWFGTAEYSIPIFEQENGLGVRVAAFYDVGSVGGGSYNYNLSDYSDNWGLGLRAPEWNQREQATQSRLASQGLDPTSEAAQTEMGNFNRARNDAQTSAMASAIGQGTEAGNAIFNQGATSQMMPYQQLGALQGLSQQSTVPMAGQAQTPDLLGAGQQQYQAALNSNAQQQSGKNSTLSGLGSLAGMAGGMMLGGPAGAALGSSLGGAAGGALGKMG